MTARTWLTGLLMLPLLVGAAPMILECRPDSGGWMDLLGGSSLEKVEQLAKARADALDLHFTRFGVAGADDAEPKPGVLVSFNDTGWLMVIRLEGGEQRQAPGGKLELYLTTDAAATADPRVPHRLILDFDDLGFTGKMAPNYMGAALVIEERNTRITGLRLVQAHLMSEGRDYRPLRVDFKTFARAGGGHYITFFFPWGSFSDCLPIAERKGVDWRFKIVRTAPDGAQFVWGENPHPYAGYGILRWPVFREDFQANLYRQWLTAGYGNEYVDQKGGLQSLWTVSAREYDYGFLAVDGPTYEPRNKASDRLFFKTALEPLIIKNQKLAEAVSKPSLSTKPLAVLTLPAPVQKLIYAELPRLSTFRHEVDDRRRDYLLNCLLGRAPLLPPEQATKTTDITEASWDSVETEAGKVSIELDDVKF